MHIKARWPAEKGIEYVDEQLAGFHPWRLGFGNADPGNGYHLTNEHFWEISASVRCQVTEVRQTPVPCR